MFINICVRGASTSDDTSCVCTHQQQFNGNAGHAGSCHQTNKISEGEWQMEKQSRFMVLLEQSTGTKQGGWRPIGAHNERRGDEARWANAACQKL